MCNFNRELNQMDSCIAQSSLFNTLETLTLAETYAGKSSFAGDIYGIAAFLAVANNYYVKEVTKCQKVTTIGYTNLTDPPANLWIHLF